MTQSLSLTTYDLMSYYGTGNFGLFDRCFNRALDSLGLDFEIEENSRKYFRNSVLRYLRCLGYVEIFNYGSKTTWCVPKPCLVQRAEKSFVLVGGSQAEWTIADHAQGLRQISRSFNDPIKVDIDPLEFPIGHSDAQKLSAQADFRLSLNYQKQLFDLLPSLKSVYRKVLDAEHGSVNLDPRHSHIYSIENKRWESFTDGLPVEEGLYKTQFLDMKTIFFLVSSDRHRSKCISSIYSSEWALVCLFGKLKLKIKLHYDAQGKQLKIERVGYLNFPTLIERCLRSGTIMSPKYEGNWAVYENIDVRSYWLLLSKYPLFQVET
ncbi:hypothetical protein KA183_19640 [bacterium]|nr:hypothetical protein [bacterium]